MTNVETLTLAFPDEDTAQVWYGILTSIIAGSDADRAASPPAPASPSPAVAAGGTSAPTSLVALSPSSARSVETASTDVAVASPGAAASVAAEVVETAAPDVVTKDSEVPSGPSSRRASTTEAASRPAHSVLRRFSVAAAALRSVAAVPSMPHESGEGASKTADGEEKPAAAAAGRLPGAGEHVRSAAPPEHARRRWRVSHKADGMTVYFEDEEVGGYGGGLMVTTSVRGSPSATMREILRVTENMFVIPGGPAETQNVDSHTTLLRRRVYIPGWRFLGAAPREVVMLRTWRHDPDGSYLIVFQSVSDDARSSGTFDPSRLNASAGSIRVDRDVETEQGGLVGLIRNFLAPRTGVVRMAVPAAGVTVSPLRPELRLGGKSQECLVTVLFKVDLGGWLSTRAFQNSPLGYAAMAPFRAAARDTWCKQTIKMLTIARSRTDHARFIAQPLADVGDAEMPTSRAKAQAQTKASAQPDLARESVDSVLAPSEDGALSEYSVRAAGAQVGGSLARRELTPLHIPSGGAAAPLSATPSVASPLASPASTQAPGALPRSSTTAPRSESEEEGAEEPGEPTEDELWALHGTNPSRFWLDPGEAGLKLRGANYLVDRKKFPALPPVFKLLSTDLVDVDEPLGHVARFLPSIKYSPAPFTFVFNLMLPCRPPQSLVASWTYPLHPLRHSVDELVASYPGEDKDGSLRAFFLNLQDWLRGTGPEADARRNRRLKLVPRIAQGSWVVRRAVGTTPVLLGQKVTTRYFSSKRYIEVDVDITSNAVANSITGLVIGAITSLVVDWGIVLEGQCPEHLPERLLGTVQFKHLELKGAPYLDDQTGTIVRKN